MVTSTVSGKGWVVIPQELRKRYHLKKGAKVHFIDYGGVISIVPASDNPIERARGMLKGQDSLVQVLLDSHAEEVKKDR